MYFYLCKISEFIWFILKFNLFATVSRYHLVVQMIYIYIYIYRFFYLLWSFYRYRFKSYIGSIYFQSFCGRRVHDFNPIGSIKKYIWVVSLSLSLSVYVYMYIYKCVCVCVHYLLKCWKHSYLPPFYLIAQSILIF